MNPLAVLLLLLSLPAVAGASQCASDTLLIDARFDGGRLDYCEFVDNDSVILTFRSEDYRVEDMFAWFAFHIAADEPRDITIKLQFPDAYARFWPKLSTDGRSWQPADEDVVARSEVGKSMTLRLTVDEAGTWVSAQELLTQRYYEDWMAALDAHFDISTSVIGRSRQDRPLWLAETADRPEAIVLLGRQHPAEVPGALAMRDFVDVLLGSSGLAREFRSRYKLVIVPLINPDGVALGHARHNDGRTDLNRDWGPFSQPETQSLAGLLDDLDARGVRPRLMLDFHATKETPTMVFYTQMPDDGAEPEGFATAWLSGVAERIEDFDFKHDPRPPSGLDNTKNYFFSRYNIPAITYEIGDEADRADVLEHTPVFAEEMMRQMLEASRAD